MNSTEFVSLINELTPSQQSPYVLATISSSYSGGRPKLVFDGSLSDTTSTYPYLSSYTPASNDRVLCARVGGSIVILGKIKTT